MQNKADRHDSKISLIFLIRLNINTNYADISYIYIIYIFLLYTQFYLPENIVKAKILNMENKDKIHDKKKKEKKDTILQKTKILLSCIFYKNIFKYNPSHVAIN